YRRYALGWEGLEPSLRSPRSGFTVPRLLFADVHAGPWTRTRRLCRADAVRHARLWSSRLVSPLAQQAQLLSDHGSAPRPRNRAANCWHRCVSPVPANRTVVPPGSRTTTILHPLLSSDQPGSCASVSASAPLAGRSAAAAMRAARKVSDCGVVQRVMAEIS